jgi:hypothetical protein
MGKICPVVTVFWLIMNQGPYKIQAVKNKSHQKIIQSKSLLYRMPIGPFGLVQLSFIHNLI